MKAMWPNDQGLKIFIPGLSFNFQIIHFLQILNAELIGQSKVILAESFVVRLCGVEIICP